MPRHAVKLICTEKEQVELERLSKSCTEPKQLIERAKIILDCLQGKENKSIGIAYKTRPNRIAKWRCRFAQFGLAGLSDATRSGKPSKAVELRRCILEKLETSPPKGQACWDGKSGRQEES